MLALHEPWLRRLLRLSLVVLMVFAGVSHFVTPGFFTVMVPPQLPWPLALVLISGAAEIGLGLGLLHPRLRRLAANGLIALYIAVFPANIYMALAEIQLAGIHTEPWVLWARLPMQAVFILWAYFVGRGPVLPVKAASDPESTVS